MSDLISMQTALDAIEKTIKANSSIHYEMRYWEDGMNCAKNILENLPSADAVEVVRCRDCRYFDLDHFENFKGIPLIVAHEICNRWGNGCKTDSNGFCFMGERRSE